jgi:integrase
MALTVKQIEALKPAEKPYKVSDGESMYVLVTPEGGKLWQMSYRTAPDAEGKRKQKVVSFGQYGQTPPGVSLAAARIKRADIKKMLAAGIDPMVAKAEGKAKTAAALIGGDRPFSVCADEWLEKRKKGGDAEKTITGNAHRVGLLKKASFADKAVNKISRAEVKAFLSGFDALGQIETLHRLRSIGSRIYSSATDADEGVPANPFRPFDKDAFADKVTRHRAAFTKVGDAEKLFKAMAADCHDTRTSPTVGLALRLLPLLGVRPGREFGEMQWSEIDWTTSRWTVPAERMKERKEHVVPLSRQALRILRQLQEITGHCKYVFAVTDAPVNRPGGGHHKDAPLGRGTLQKRLRKLGFDTAEGHTSHGFRVTLSTLLHAERKPKSDEPAFPSEWIELQLAHLDETSVKAIYNRQGALAEIDGRTRMMQHWADMIDRMVASGDPVPLRKIG